MRFVLNKQLAALKNLYPEGKGRVVKRQNGLVLEWRSYVQPSKLSRKYEVQVTWRGISDIPIIEILHPNLRELADGKRSPHEFYSDSNTKPCVLFNRRGSNDWHAKMLIAESIIPWTMEWLLYWELWLSTGEWLGGGVHPGELTIEQYLSQLSVVNDKHLKG
ncbi:hypothetical protein [Enterovibrio norvegicus]|uniref:Type II CBASS E2 protein domain-containing protein n=1 Tax=Enterovibrio norvegicus TaxID=188144 RepID=A0A2N7L9U7_9GAMM|nr:hypothetical protein [Enterovibrio norvegicus]PMN91333.1 hypothetical protein BCT23_17640 [Enterovibrio norvegicus]